MKKLILIAAVFPVFNGNSQVIAPLTSGYEADVPTYWMDKTVEMDRFVGTWKSSGSPDTLTLELRKDVKVPSETNFEDLLVGEYKYESGGTTIVNYLPLMDNITVKGLEHNIAGRDIWPNNYYYYCVDCGATEKRFTLRFYDPERTYLSTVHIILRYVIDSSPSQLKVVIIDSDSGIIPNENSPTETRVPFGEYLLTKQP